MARIPVGRDTFLPRIESVFYATFHETRGPEIVYQVPEGRIQHGSVGNVGSSVFSATAGGPPMRSSGSVPGTPSNNSSVSVGPVSSPTSFTPSSSSIHLLRSEKPRPDAPRLTHHSTNSTTSIEVSSPSSPVSHRSAQEQHANPHPHPPSSTSSPHKPAHHSASCPKTPLLDFSDVSRYVIPPQKMCGRLIVISTRTHRVMGFPVCLEGKYKRVHFRYNLCFVFERTADLSCYEPVVRKIARVLMACEEESSFLSDPHTEPQIYPILEQLFEDLNNYHETSIPIIDQFNSIELKLLPFYPNPPKVYDWTVPLALINLTKQVEPNWDLTMIKICRHIDGINHVSRIANMADCDLELTRQAVSHLLYYQCIMTVDIFQYSNIYTLERSLQWLADDPTAKEECGPYVTKPGHDVPEWPHLLFLYSRLKPGKTVFEWEEEHGVRAQGIDVRRFMSFGVIKGFLRRVHRWPILLPEKPSMSPIESPEAVITNTKPAGGRRRGKNFSHTPKDGPRSPEVQRECSHSQSQSQLPTHSRARTLTEAEQYARSIQLREDLDTRSRRLSLQDRPVPCRQHSGQGTPRPQLVNLPGIDRPQLKLHGSDIVPPPPPPDTFLDFHLPLYPPDLPALLDGSHHTDELATRFEAGWPTLEKWLVAVGDGKGNGDFGRVTIMYR